MAKQQQVMRASKGYQNNQMKKVMADLGAEDLDFKKMKKFGVGGVVGGLVITVLLTIFFKWIGLACGILIFAIAAGVFYSKVAEKQKKMVMVFKTLGFTKDEYAASFDAMKGNEMLKKVLINLWEQTPEPEKVIQQKGRPQKVGQSKQNKKKRKYKK